MPFALKSEGCYYKFGDRHKVEEERNGETRTWYEVDGKVIVRCTCGGCGKYDFRETFWTKSGQAFWDFVGI